MWEYNWKELNEVPKGAVGFVYKIINRDTQEYYIGKKLFQKKVTRPPLKGYKRKRVEFKESDWRTYQGSNEIVKEWKNVRKEILYICYDKINLTYYEAKELFCECAIENHNNLCINGNILGKFFRGRIE